MGKKISSSQVQDGHGIPDSAAAAEGQFFHHIEQEAAGIHPRAHGKSKKQQKQQEALAESSLPPASAAQAKPTGDQRNHRKSSSSAGSNLPSTHQMKTRSGSGSSDVHGPGLTDALSHAGGEMMKHAERRMS